jgi:hypothetical protein
MFTKKLEDQFSADLLNTVRGVLGEAKHDKECECEKCEKEEEEDDEDEDEKDEMKKEGYVSHAQRKAVWANRADDGAGHPDKKKKMKKEGYVPTADEPSEKDKKVAQKIRDMMAKEKKPVKEDAEELDELSKATMGSYVNKAAERIGTQGVTAGLKIAADEKSSKNFKNMGKRQKGIATAVSKLTKEEQDFIDSLNDAGVEQIDELSGATLGSYMVKSKKDETARKEHGIKVRDEIRKQTGLNVGTPMDRKLYSPTASRGAGQKTAMKKLTGQARVNAKEEFELEEGRGRPPKEGSAAWKARQGKADDDMVSLGMQLRKAKSINKKVRFMNGKEHDIHPNHINRFEDHMAARRTTQEKDNFQKQAHKSHEDFVKAVSAPVPKAAKDTGEIVKYRH